MQKYFQIFISQENGRIHLQAIKKLNLKINKQRFNTKSNNKIINIKKA